MMVRVNKIHIVHYISTLSNGGAQTQLKLLCNNIDKSKYSVTIVCWSDEVVNDLSEDIKIKRILRGKKSQIFSFFTNVYKSVNALDPDIVHLWLPELITLPASIAARKTGKPIINSERRLPSTNVGKIVYYRDHIEYIIHLLSDKIVTNFPIPIQRKSMFNLLLRNKGLTIYNGINLRNNKLYPLPVSSEFKIAFCGRFVRQKNIDILLLSISLLISKGYKVKLDLYGKGELEPELREIVNENNLKNNVTFKGYSPNWLSYSDQYNCFVLPTSREGMPNVLFEAGSYGMPIISTNIEEISCHFTNLHDAILVSDRSIDQLTNAFIQLIENLELCNKLRKQALITIQKYSVENMVEQYNSLYQALLN